MRKICQGQIPAVGSSSIKPQRAQAPSMPPIKTMMKESLPMLNDVTGENAMPMKI
jgi:hypothetical protein